MAIMIKHKVNGNKEVIFNGVRYSPDKDGFVMLPGTLETIDVVPVIDENTPDSGKVETSGTENTTENGKKKSGGK